MAYDEELAERIRAALPPGLDLAERRMFGGLAFLVSGNLAVAASGEGGLLLRVDPARTDELAGRAGASVAVMRGRPMTGWIRVTADAVRTEEALRAWVDRAVAHAASLPPK